MPIRVLLADDHAVLRQGMKVVLEDADDITVVGEAGDGREVVRLAKQLSPDVVVMDIAMPELNGIEATLQIHRCCPSTRIVILSVYASPERIFRGLQAGAQAYLVKESAIDQVIEAVHSVYAGRRYLCPKVSDIVLGDFMLRPRTAQDKSPLERLSARERELLQLLAEGKSNAEIAGILFLSVKSVETYRSRLMQKLGLKSVPSLVKFAIQHGMISLDS